MRQSEYRRTRSLRPTCYQCDYSTVTEDGKLFDASKPQGEAGTRLNSVLLCLQFPKPCAYTNVIQH